MGWRDWLDPIAAAGGGLVGGVVGLVASGGNPMGAVAGAGLGYAAGDALVDDPEDVEAARQRERDRAAAAGTALQSRNQLNAAIAQAQGQGGGISAATQRSMFQDFSQQVGEQERIRMSEVARDAARRGLVTSGQVTALQRDIGNRGDRARDAYRSQLGFESERMGLQSRLAALQALGGQYAADKGYQQQMALLQTQLAAQAEAGEGQFTGELAKLALMYFMFNQGKGQDFSMGGPV